MSNGFLQIAIAAVLMLAGSGLPLFLPGLEPEGLGSYRGAALSALALYLVLEAWRLRRRLGQLPAGVVAEAARASALRLLAAGLLAVGLALSSLIPIPPPYASLWGYRDLILLALAVYVLIEAVLAQRRMPGALPGPALASAPTELASARGRGLRVAGLAVAGLVLVVLYSSAMPPGTLPAGWLAYRDVLLAAVLVLILIDALVAVRRGGVTPSPTAVSPVKVPRPPRLEEGADYGEVLAFLALLQDQGRFIDFVMEDIAPYNDAQVAAASRVVHEGCAAVMREYLDISPLHGGREGDAMTVDTATDAQRYKLVGRVVGSPPYRGVVVHRGWKTAKLALPRYTLPVNRSALNVITPVEVEVR